MSPLPTTSDYMRTCWESVPWPSRGGSLHHAGWDGLREADDGEALRVQVMITALLPHLVTTWKCTQHEVGPQPHGLERMSSFEVGWKVAGM